MILTAVACFILAEIEIGSFFCCMIDFVNRFSLFRPLLIVVVMLELVACNGKADTKKEVVIPTEAARDTLPDQSQFHYTIDDHRYAVDSADIDVHYSVSDSVLTIDAGKASGDRINITILDIKHTPAYRGNGWRSGNTKLAGSDSLIDQPTVTFSKNDNGLSSWNNLDDGFHNQPVRNDSSVHVYSLRRTGERTFVIKGHIRTRLLKNVYESRMVEFNRDHLLSGDFVINFEDYYLDL